MNFEECIMLIDNSSFSNISSKLEYRFPTSNWKHIFALLGLAVVADTDLPQEKIDTYLNVIIELRSVIDPSAYITRHMARDWFTLNRSYLEEVVESLIVNDDTVLCNIIAPIKTTPHILDIITGMVTISLSDNTYSGVENDLIKKTILYWNVRSGAYDKADNFGAKKFAERAILEATIDYLWETSPARP